MTGGPVNIVTKPCLRSSPIFGSGSCAGVASPQDPGEDDERLLHDRPWDEEEGASQASYTEGSTIPGHLIELTRVCASISVSPPRRKAANRADRCSRRRRIDARSQPAGVAEWQTRWIQNPVRATSCGFDSHLRYLLCLKRDCVEIAGDLLSDARRPAVGVQNWHICPARCRAKMPRRAGPPPATVPACEMLP